MARTAGSCKSNFKEIKSCQRNKTSKKENPYKGKRTQKDRLQKPHGGWLSHRAILSLGCPDLASALRGGAGWGVGGGALQPGWARRRGRGGRRWDVQGWRVRETPTFLLPFHFFCHVPPAAVTSSLLLGCSGPGPGSGLRVHRSQNIPPGRCWRLPPRPPPAPRHGPSRVPLLPRPAISR